MTEFVEINGNFNEPWLHGVERHVENGWHMFTARTADEVGDQGIKVSKGWTIRFADATVSNPFDDGEDSSKFAKPEWDIKENAKLPPAERAGQPGQLCLFPPYVYKPYKRGRAIMTELIRWLDEPGRYVFRPQVRPDPVSHYENGKKVYADDRAAFVYFVDGGMVSQDDFIDLTPKDNVAEWVQLEFQFDVTGDGQWFGLGFFNPWGLWEGNNWFLDGWTLEKIGELPNGGRGKPRFQYHRTYVLLHTSAGKGWANAVNDATWDTNHYTLGSSADDSGIGDLDVRKIVAVNPQLWGPGNDGRGLLGFYETHYPGVDARQVVVDTPSALVALLKATPFKDLPQLQPYEEPTPPNGGEPDNSPPDEITTWHRQTNEDGLDQYPEGMPVEAIKLVLGGEDAVRYMYKGYKTVDIRFIVDHQGQFIEAMNVNGFLANFEDAVDQVVTDVQAHFPGRAIYLETTNEEDPNNPKVIEFECRTSDEIYRRWNPYVIGVLGNFAVGNGEGQALLPLAQTAYKNKHLIGYHMYFPVDLVNAERWMVEEAKWYHMRMLYHIDPVFRANNVFPLYASTEGGPVKAIAQGSFAAMFSRAAAWARREKFTGPRVAMLDPAWLEAKRLWNENPRAIEWVQRQMTDTSLTAVYGVGPLDPGGGWRHPDALNADLARTVALKMQKRQMILDWNAEHGHRVRFDSEFTVGADFVGWKWFKWWRDDILAVRAAILQGG